MTNDPMTPSPQNKKQKKKTIKRLLTITYITIQNYINYPYLKSYWVRCGWNVLVSDHGVIDHWIIE